MARIRSTALIGLPVVSESGIRLGHVRSFDVDTESHLIVSYTVKPRGIAAIVGTHDLVIHPMNVVAIAEAQMTVRDAVTPVPAIAKDSRASLKKNELPALSREG